MVSELYNEHGYQHHPINGRVMTVRLTAHPYNVTVVQFYSPTSDATIVEVETFYDILQETLDSIPNRDIKVIVGDANAKLEEWLMQMQSMTNMD